jgi:hypothetical protein
MNKRGMQISSKDINLLQMKDEGAVYEGLSSTSDESELADIIVEDIDALPSTHRKSMLS